LKSSDSRQLLKKQPSSDPQAVLNRLMALCSRKECCVWHIQRRLDQTTLDDEQRQAILQKLLRDRFVDNRRFVEIYCRDRCLRARWGWNKIRNGLTRWGLRDHLEEARRWCLELDPNQSALNDLATAKWNSMILPGESLSFLERQKRCAKLSRFLLGKGYAPDDVFARVRFYFEPS
jgi:regulatory protein